ncbi:uncharacterized protein LOC131284733 [Anopheles ziemanni]|uniref:uncharacterized protein LOC131259016 n=1 Tax=Anopheles coustani TaxID=139045 RepID=UPI00265B6D4E|nr:uncharacterized protein LOC131259016 [Anopheles coustani]XP_058169577.1 uncharacterized protein LOC131284733 [Anopheles ziemanni]
MKTQNGIKVKIVEDKPRYVWWKAYRLRQKRKVCKARAKKSSIHLITNQQQSDPHLAGISEAVDTNWSIDSYRQPSDTNSFWNLKKWFMELHKETIPEDELITLAQAFANAEALGCCYPPELMDRLKRLGEPIARVYRNLKTNKCTPTFVPASDAARLDLHRITYGQHLDYVKQWHIANLRPIIPTYSLAEVFQNIVVVNNSLKETTEWFERLDCGTISLVMQQLKPTEFEVKAFVCNIFITKATGSYDRAYSQCVADLIEIFKNYCYQVNYITRFPCLQYNVEKLVDETDGQSKCLRNDNIGYRMLQKLGWTGGPLGSNHTGIIDPISVPAKHDRRGLGCTKPTKKKRSSKACEQHCSMDVPFYNDLMDAALARRPYYDLIFSPEFNESERIILTRLAVQRRLRCETRLLEDGQMQFTIKRYPLPPHEVLLRVLVDKDPLIRKFYAVLPPKFGRIPK